jgi:hypothetical protein
MSESGSDLEIIDVVLASEPVEVISLLSDSGGDSDNTASNKKICNKTHLQKTTLAHRLAHHRENIKEGWYKYFFTYSISLNWDK